MTLDMMAQDAEAVARLLASVDAVSHEIGRQRARMRSSWQVQSKAIECIEAQVRAVDYSFDRRKKAFDELVRSFGNNPDRQRDYAVPKADITGWLQGNGNGTWAVRAEIERQFDIDYANARQQFIESMSKTFGGGARRAGLESLGRYSLRLTRLKEVRQLLEVEVLRAEEDRREAASNERTMAENALVPAVALAMQSLDRLPAPLQPWGNDIWGDWSSWEPVEGIEALFAGVLVPLEDEELGTNSDFGSETRIPLFVSLRQNLQVIYNNANRDQALEFSRSLLLRQLAVAPAGEWNFHLYDPIGLGQSIAELLDLAEYDPNLIGGKVWSSSKDLATRLAEQTSHIELVTQKYLRSTYESIDDFNQAAGEVAEPYRLIVLFDCPAGLSEESVKQLKSIVLNGPRCGVYTLLLTNSSENPPIGSDLDGLAGTVRSIVLSANFVKEHQGYSLRLRLRPEARTPAAATQARTIVETVGRAAIGRTEAAVTFEKVIGLLASTASRGIRKELTQTVVGVQVDDVATWWAEQSTNGIYAPIGQMGARDAAILGFDSSDHSGALLVGRPGSGKSTLLHAYIAGLTTLFGPDELELYLIDFKEGVEFKSYAAERLPHARVVAVESDREYGMSVLQTLKDELTRRGQLFRSAGGDHAGIVEFRQASGRPLPRVLLIFDEFQVLFAKNDKIGLAAADLLETIIRQGRGFGIHVLLGSQSLSGLDALGAHVPQLLPTRILLSSTELDYRRVLGDDNDGGRYLTAHGEGILNRAGGAIEANERFRGALLTEEDRLRRLKILREKADRAGFNRRPIVFDGNTSVPIESIQPERFREELAASGNSAIRLRVGAGMTLTGLADVELKRESGANVLAVLRSDVIDGLGVAANASPAYGLLATAVASAAQSTATIDVIDFLSVDDGLDQVMEPFLEVGRITLRRRRAFAPLIHELAAEVKDRVDQDDFFRTPRIALLFGIHRARELDAEIGSVDADAELSDALEGVMRDGPEVGVHVWMWADSVIGASRRLTSRMMRECSWRIAGKMSSDDSLSLIGTEQAGEIRERQLVLSNDDLGVATRAMSFSVPTRDWLDAVLGAANPNRDAEEN